MTSSADGHDLNDLTRDAYAHFGLAYYLSECAFQGLVQVLATDGVAVTIGAVEERTKQFSRYTLGPLVEAAKGAIPTEYHIALDRLVERRNRLAHGFWYERVHQMTSMVGLEALVHELQEDQELFQGLSRMTDEMVRPRLVAAGMPSEWWDVAMQEAQAGPPDPLPDRRVPRAGARITLQRAWALHGGGLVFQDEAGDMWQLGELGLGWYIGETAPDWIVKWVELLPATVVARPKLAKPWDYTLEFSSGLRLRASLDEATGMPKVTFSRRKR